MASQENPRYVALLPAMLQWIDRTLASCDRVRRSVRSFNFQRLPHYFSETILTDTGVVVVDRVPTPPLSALGLIEFKSFEEQDLVGITFKDTYFLQTDCAYSESLHFHELVHVMQWKALGPEQFLLLYADGLARYGYDGSPLESMAFRRQAQFDSGRGAYNVDVEVTQETLTLASLG